MCVLYYERTNRNHEINWCQVRFIGYNDRCRDHDEVEYDFDRPCLPIGCWLTICNNGRHEKEECGDSSDTEIPTNTNTRS